MTRVGITGGIGSGKTTVSRIFESIGIPVYNADTRAREMMQSDPSLIAKITELFGKDIYAPGNVLRREVLAGIVFRDKTKLDALNAIVHPATMKDFDRWTSQQTGAPYLLKEAALIFESGSWKHLDCVITVTAPEELRIQRIMTRNGASREEILARMKNQLPEEEKAKRSKYVIINDEKHSLVEQVMKLNAEISPPAA